LGSFIYSFSKVIYNNEINEWLLYYCVRKSTWGKTLLKKHISVWWSIILCIAGFIVLCSFHDPLSYEDKAESDIKNFMIEDGKQTDMEIPEGLLSEEWDAIQIRLQKARYYPTWSRAAQGYVAANPEHKWGIN
jgi:hypothetical protein